MRGMGIPGLGHAGFGLSVQPFLNAFLRLGIKPSESVDRTLRKGSRSCSTEAGINLDEDMTKIGTSRKKIEVDGTLLNWDKAGSGEHVVLLLPGIIGSIQTDFVPIFQQMNKQKFTLVSWDPPGYGKSRPPSRDFTGVFYQRDGHLVVKLMDKLGYNKFSILGWSNGGITGSHIAADYPERVRKLVTWGSHAFADERAVMFTKMMGNLDLWSPQMLKPVLALYGKDYLQQMLNDWHQAVSDYHFKGQDKTLLSGYAKTICPVLAIHGENDPVLGIEHAEFRRDNIKNCRLYVWPGAKHNLHLKFTKEFLEIVSDFLSEN